MVKKALPVLLFIIFCSSISASSQGLKKDITGFLDISFGSSKEAVIAAAKAKSGKIFKNDEDQVSFKNITLGTRRAALLTVKFIDNKAFEADFFFNPPSKTQAIKYYNKLNSELTGIYGQSQPFRITNGAYQKGHISELSAIKLGQVEYSSYWTDMLLDDANLLKTSITRSLSIELTYQDGKLLKLDIKRQVLRKQNGT